MPVGTDEVGLALAVEEALESAFLLEQAARTGMVVANPAKARALRRL